MNIPTSKNVVPSDGNVSPPPSQAESIQFAGLGESDQPNGVQSAGLHQQVAELLMATLNQSPSSWQTYLQQQASHAPLAQPMPPQQSAPSVSQKIMQPQSSPPQTTGTLQFFQQQASPPQPLSQRSAQQDEPVSSAQSAHQLPQRIFPSQPPSPFGPVFQHQFQACPHRAQIKRVDESHQNPLFHRAQSEMSRQWSSSTVADSSVLGDMGGLGPNCGTAGFKTRDGMPRYTQAGSLASGYHPQPLLQPIFNGMTGAVGNGNIPWNTGGGRDIPHVMLQSGRNYFRSQPQSPDAYRMLPRLPQISVISVLDKGPLQVCVIGSGNWGTAVARVVALNSRSSHIFRDTIYMWTYEELLNNGRKISEVINIDHENSKYLPGVRLPINLVAVTDLVECARQADLICFVIPHQFVERICEQLQGHLKPSARAVTFVKGLAIKNGIPRLYSEVISDTLQIGCDAVSGANVAKDLSADQFCESTVGYTDAEMALIWQQLFDRPCFRIHAVPDPAGVQVCGALKNLVALAAGFCDGLGVSTNSKSAIIRIGMVEMKLFATLFFDGVLEDTFNESAGLADMVTTCFGGSRSLKCAAEFVIHEGRKMWTEVEADVLKGQRLQGRLACADVHSVLENFGVTDLFPLFHQCYEIAFNQAPSATLLKVFMHRPAARVRLVSDCNDIRIPRYLAEFRQLVTKTIRQVTASTAKFIV